MDEKRAATPIEATSLIFEQSFPADCNNPREDGSTNEGENLPVDNKSINLAADVVIALRTKVSGFE